MNTTQYLNTLDSVNNCHICGESGVTSSIEKDSFTYGTGQDAETISVDIRVHHCAKCGSSFTTEDASEVRHNAVCKHLGVYNPHEIRCLREKYHLTQAELSDITKIGKASLARWEGGLLIQNLSNDNLLYLLNFPENLTRLKSKWLNNETQEVKNHTNVLPFKPKFKTIKPADIEEMQHKASMFELYPSALEA